MGRALVGFLLCSEEPLLKSSSISGSTGSGATKSARVADQCAHMSDCDCT